MFITDSQSFISNSKILELYKLKYFMHSGQTQLAEETDYEVFIMFLFSYFYEYS